MVLEPSPWGEGSFDDGAAPSLRRLRVRAEFLRVAQGLSAARGAVVVQARLREPVGPIGVGFTATKKIGGAVVRNRAKRRLREAARVMLPEFGRAGFDYVFVARAGTPDREWPRLLDDVKSALISVAAGGDPPRNRAASGRARRRDSSGPAPTP